MRHISSVNGSCRDRPCGVKAEASKNKGALAGSCARARSIKCSDRTVWTTQEAVSYVAGVNVASGDNPHRIDVAGEGTFAGTCARTRHVEGSDHTVGSAQEAMKRIGGVVVVTRAR